MMTERRTEAHSSSKWLGEEARVRTPTQIARFVFLALTFALALTAVAQTPPHGEVAALYRELRSVGLDPAQVYHIRDAVLDRDDLHLYLTDGTIAFTKTVSGRITGAYFEGEGEILVRPPDMAERSSLGLFADTGVLNEHFNSAYLRFNDDTYKELLPQLRETDEAATFIQENAEGAERLAQMDALRLLCSFTSTFAAKQDPQDRFLHARLGGVQLGGFDVFYDALYDEQITIGNFKTEQDVTYYDIWMSFPGRRARMDKSGERVIDPWRSTASVDIPRFRIAAHLLPPQNIEADALLELNVKHGGQRLLVFELSRYLKVDQVTMGDQSLEFLQNESVDGTQLAKRGNDVVVVVMPQPLQDGQRFTLRFRYSGNVMTQAGEGLLYVGARGTWYPNRGPWMSRFDLEFRWPEQWTLVATGKRVALETRGTELVGRWQSEVPMPFAGFNLGQYSKKMVKAGDVTVETFASGTVEEVLRPRPKALPPTHSAQRQNPSDVGEIIEVAPPAINPAVRSQSVADSCAHAIEAYTEWFGPYPYSTLALTQFPSAESQGWPGLVFLSSAVFLTPEEKANLKLSEFGTILYGDLMPWHETAHMWWGDVVLWRSYRDQWLVEALSNYSAMMLMEQERPADFRKVLNYYRNNLLLKSPNGKQYLEAGPVNLGARLSSSQFPGGYANITYGRGTWLIYMLHRMLRDAAPAGDDPFMRGLRLLRERYAFKEVSTADLQKIFEEVMPEKLRYDGRKSLDWFFQGWVSGTAIPSYSLDDVKISSQKEKTVATFKIMQKDAPKTLITPVPIYAEFAGGKQVFAGRVFADGEQTVARLTVPAGTKRLIVDPAETLLRRVDGR